MSMKTELAALKKQRDAGEITAFKFRQGTRKIKNKYGVDAPSNVVKILRPKASSGSDSRYRPGKGGTASKVKATQTERNQRELAKMAANSPTGTVLSNKTKVRTAAAEKRLQDGIKAQQATKKPKRMGGEVTYTGSGPKKISNTPYKIKSGDTLSAIAARNETTVAALKKLNNIKDVNKIRAGASLKIPKKVRPSLPTPRPKRK